MGTWDNFSNGASTHKSIDTLHPNYVFQHFASIRSFQRDRRGIHVGWTNWRSDYSVFWVLKHFSTSSAEALSSTQIWKCVTAPTNPAVLWKRNRTAAVIDVDVETPVKPCKSSTVGNQIGKGPPHLNPEKQHYNLVSRPSSRSSQWNRRQWRRLSRGILELIQCLVWLWEVSWMYLMTLPQVTFCGIIACAPRFSEATGAELKVEGSHWGDPQALWMWATRKCTVFMEMCFRCT